MGGWVGGWVVYLLGGKHLSAVVATVTVGV